MMLLCKKLLKPLFPLLLGLFSVAKDKAVHIMDVEAGKLIKRIPKAHRYQNFCTPGEHIHTDRQRVVCDFSTAKCLADKGLAIF